MATRCGPSSGWTDGEPFRGASMIFSPEFGLLALNLLLGFGCALPLAGYLRGLFLKPVGNFRLWAALIGIYFSEGVAVGIGMGIPVFSAGLAFVWGAVFAR